ncbi:MAG: hypothetical protein CMF55_04935, partial [Legionellales bacterium]|nr:hypothetical protein [Legionellales bacterium]
MSDIENSGRDEDLPYARLPASDDEAPSNASDLPLNADLHHAIGGRLSNEMLWQLVLYSLSGGYVGYHLWKVFNKPSDYLAADWNELRDNYHHLEILSFIDLRASWCTGVLPSLIWQIVSGFEEFLYGQWLDLEKVDDNTYWGMCLKRLPLSLVSPQRQSELEGINQADQSYGNVLSTLGYLMSSSRNWYTRYHWNNLINNPSQREVYQDEWLSYRRSHFLRIMATLLFAFPVLLCVVFSYPWANYASNFTTILNDAPPDAPSSFWGWVHRFFPDLSSLKVMNNLLPASICWMSVLWMYSTLKVVDAGYFLLNYFAKGSIDIQQQAEGEIFPVIEQSASTALVGSLLLFIPVTALWLCSTTKGGGIEVYLGELINDDDRRDLLAVALGWIRQLPQVNHGAQPTLCFNQTVSFNLSPWTNLTHVCIESFEFSQYVDVTRGRDMYLAAWGETKLPVPWSASFVYQGMDALGVEQTGVWNVSRQQVGIFPFMNLGEVTLLEELGVYPIASVLFYLTAPVFKYSSASLLWADQYVMPIYQRIVSAIDQYKLIFFVPAFFMMVVLSKCLGGDMDHLNSQLSPQAENF